MGAVMTIEIAKIAQVQLTVNDLERANRFNEKVLRYLHSVAILSERSPQQRALLSNHVTYRRSQRVNCGRIVRGCRGVGSAISRPHLEPSY
jgi:hypothetical protein